MRLEARIKSGFYPLQPGFVPLIAKHLQVDPNVTIFDPCCGNGVAVISLAQQLGIKPESVYGAELDEGRAQVAKANVANCFGPIDFLTAIGNGSASIIYCNPPFDDELGGGGRVEMRFIAKCLEFAKINTVFIIVLPKTTMTSHSTFEYLNQKLYGVRCYELPSARFKECVLFGYRRKVDIRADLSRIRDYRPRPDISEVADRYVCRPGGSVAMRKQFYTEVECSGFAARSSANQILRPVRRQQVSEISPPMSLTRGHIALLLASGLFDGIVEPEGEKPHVVRGSVSKVKKSDVSREDGKVIERISEQITLTIRTADLAGVHTLTSEVATSEEEETKCE